ncbi:hypothetical protein ETD86_20245 [Nonomuraea turkmeniaca]|uniref:Uncharacterized protein n=1 Tax=Nonomuraea turkmeniaca TaxID=103838 RepID=A0A5S4FHF6_9ACTN|nr:hypothetical protein ETD86_20245 [Nonomuraea turkmeniaca]
MGWPVGAILARVCAAQFMVVVDVSVINVALPSIRDAGSVTWATCSRVSPSSPASTAYERSRAPGHGGACHAAAVACAAASCRCGEPTLYVPNNAMHSGSGAATTSGRTSITPDLLRTRLRAIPQAHPQISTAGEIKAADELGHSGQAGPPVSWPARRCRSAANSSALLS